MPLAVTEYVTWGGTLLVMTFFALMAYRATRTRPEDVEPEDGRDVADPARQD